MSPGYRFRLDTGRVLWRARQAPQDRYSISSKTGDFGKGGRRIYGERETGVSHRGHVEGVVRGNVLLTVYLSG